ncbi:putative DNA repair helicase RadD [Alcaligenes phage CASP1]|nr:putative DNA repair helicase RadD [Alcaligenes phage CASP1]
MPFEPRFYQQEAHDAVIDWWKHTTDPCLVEAATGAGKSWIIAMIAKTVFTISGGKRVLCLAPSADLIDQNSEKYSALGEPFSIYSASISKSLRHPVVFATEGTFKRVAKQLGSQFSAVILDEAHRITPTIKKIIEDMREGNPHLRVCGLTATPYRLGDGFIFAIDTNGKAIPQEQTRDPYYKKLVYYIGAKQLTELGFLTPVKIGDINADSYDTSGIVVQGNGKFKQSTVDAAFEGWGRETSAIVGDIVAQSVGKRGVMIFAATVRHAQEIMASLPPSMSRMIGGNVNMSKTERKDLRRAFSNEEFKYLVSVGTMTTGVDFSHVDVVAIMRHTESVSLLQQIIGRGLRLDDLKSYTLLLDYANNLEKHCPDGDIFRPEIRAAYQGGESVPLQAACEDCGGINEFSARPNDAGLDVDDYGYFVDLDGNRIQAEGVKMPMPAHYGRRCQQHLYSRETKSYERCGYYWSYKECPVCQHKNDIAARFCESCKEELINPNDKLIAIHTKKKKDPTQPQCDEVVEMEMFNTVSRAGNETIRVQFVVPSRMFSIYLQPKARNQFLLDQYEFFMNSTNGGAEKPRTVSYKKDGDFYRLLGINKPTDDEVLKDAISRLA